MLQTYILSNKSKSFHRSATRTRLECRSMAFTEEKGRVWNGGIKQCMMLTVEKIGNYVSISCIPLGLYERERHEADK